MPVYEKPSESKFPKIIKTKWQVITDFKSNRFTPKQCRYLQHNRLSTSMHLFQLDEFKNSVPAEIGLYIRNYLRTAISASSLLRSRPTPERCSCASRANDISRGSMLQHGTATPHGPWRTQELLLSSGWEMRDFPPYSLFCLLSLYLVQPA
jgi:hypothetical protein